MKIKKGDKVLITKGKYRGKTGKVLKALPGENKIVVEDINIVKKHTKPTKSGEKGKILEFPKPLFASNAKLICKKCGKAARTESKIIKDKKNRVCKKCGKQT